jgi:hypothetical protein
VGWRLEELSQYTYTDTRKRDQGQAEQDPESPLFLTATLFLPCATIRATIEKCFCLVVAATSPARPEKETWLGAARRGARRRKNVWRTERRHLSLTAGRALYSSLLDEQNIPTLISSSHSPSCAQLHRTWLSLPPSSKRD